MVDTPFGRLAGRSGLAAAVAGRERVLWRAAALLVVVFGAVLRFGGVGWDVPDGTDIPLQMHPDERFISIVNEKIEWPGSPSEYFDTSTSTLNPYNQPETPSFVYGTFPVFLAKAVATAAESDVPVVSTAASMFCERDGYDTTVLCGRRLTALADTLTIVLVMALAALLLGRGGALLAGFLYACAVLSIQISHFWTVDPYVVFFGVATALLSTLWVLEPAARPLAGPTRLRRWRMSRNARPIALLFALGLCLGLGLASKVTAWPLLLGPGIALTLRIGIREFPRLGLTMNGRRPAIGGHWSYDVMAVAAVMVLALVVFRIAQPYAFAGPHFWDMAINPTWRADIEREIDFQNGNVDFPPFIQFAGRTRFVWPVANIAIWALGPALSLAAAAGMAGAGIVAARRRDMAWLIPLAFVVAVVGFQGLRFVAYMRYFAPAFPFLAIFAAATAAWLWRAGLGRTDAATGVWGRVSRGMMPRQGRRARAAKGAALALAVAIPALTAWWAIAYTSVIRDEHPRIEASEWIYANIPIGAAITTEIWDDSLPYYLPGFGPGRYEIVNTYPFDTDSVAKVVALVYGSEGPNATAGLNGADYVILSSERVSSAVLQMEREYPATIRYYELLDSGALGFDLVATFESRPTFLGISVDDSSAEESFTVYDHPTVRIYRKSETWDPRVALALLLDAHPERAVNLLPRQGGVNGLQFTAAEFASVQEAGTFRELFSDSSPFATLTWLWWFAWVQVLAFAAVPWLTWLFRRLPDRGYGLSKLAGFAGVGLLTWLLVAWGAFDFTRGLAGGVALAFAGTGLVTGYLRRQSLAAEFRTRWPLWLACELVFAGTFAFFLALRLDLPDLWHNYQGGEKPVELAFLTAIARSATMPPYDPWYAGGTMNYYYMGWFLVAVPMRAMRILPEVGFNLAIPTYAALAAATAFSTASNLAGLGQRVSQRISRRTLIVGGIMGALLLVGIGNLDTAQQDIQRLQSLNLAGIDAAGQPVYHWELFSGVPFLGGLVGFVSGVYQWLFQDGMLPPFDWWRSSRVHTPAFDITEFPFFSFLFADLHAHLMGLPFFGLVIALCLAYVVSAERDGFRAWLLAAGLGIAMGLVRTVHTWDFPTVVLLSLAAVAAGQFLRNDRWQTRTWDGLGHTALAIGVLLVLFAPYTQHAAVTETGLVLARETTEANQYFAHFGLFVVIMIAFLAVRYHEELSARPLGPGNNPVLAAVGGKLEVISLATFVIGLSAFTWRWGLTTIALSILLLILLGNLLWLEVRMRDRNLPRIFATGLFFAAVGIAGGIDVIQVEYDIVRMNTVFKFSLQAWQLYALASAYALVYVAAALASVEDWYIRVRPGRRIAAASAATAIGVLLFGSVLYVWSGTRARQQARFENSPSGTLDGLAYLPYGYFAEDKANAEPADDVLILLADDIPLIEWLRDNVEGTPVVAEAVGPLYHWTSRISWNTGLPTVVGWDWHEVAYRTEYEYSVQVRRVETSQFFTDPSQRLARDYLRKYDVSYVVVGTTERTFGSPEGLAKFDAMPELEVVFRAEDSVIYRVKKDELGPASLVAR